MTFLSVGLAARIAELTLLGPDPADDANYFLVFRPLDEVQRGIVSHGTGVVADRKAVAYLIFGECEQLPVVA